MDNGPIVAFKVPMRLFLSRFAVLGLLPSSNALGCFSTGSTGTVMTHISTYIHHPSPFRSYRGRYRSTVQSVIQGGPIGSLPNTLLSSPTATALAGMSQMDKNIMDLTVQWEGSMSFPAVVFYTYFINKSVEILRYVIWPRFVAWVNGRPHNPLSNDKFKRERGQETEPSSFCSARGLMTCAVLALLFGSEWKHSAPARFRLLSGVTASLLAYPTAFTLWILLIRILLEQFGWLLLIWSVVDAAGSVGRLVYSELSSRDQRRKTFKELVMYGGLLVFIVMNWGDGRRIYQ